MYIWVINVPVVCMKHFQMMDNSCEGLIGILKASFYLLTEIKLDIIKFKTFHADTQAWFTRTTLANPGYFKFFSSFSLISSSCTNSTFLYCGFSIFLYRRNFSFSWPVVSPCLLGHAVYCCSFHWSF